MGENSADEEFIGSIYMHLSKIRKVSHLMSEKLSIFLEEYDIPESLFSDIMYNVLSAFTAY
jgi:hypothetical protein